MQAVRRAEICALHVSLDEPLREDGTGEAPTLGSALVDDRGPAPDEVAGARQDQAHLREAVGRVTSREVEVLSLRYGLHDGQERTLGEVGLAVGVSGQRVQQIEVQALGRVRRFLHPEQLDANN